MTERARQLAGEGLGDLQVREPRSGWEAFSKKNINMIKFFRRIRYDLMEKNKTGKPALPAGRYLIYAVGEIALVVIGILIALQINARVKWNENRNLEIEYLNAFSYELEEDISFYKNLINSLGLQNKSLRNVIEVIENPQEVILDSLQFINDYRKGGFGDVLDRSSVTWQELQSTGQMALIQDKNLIRKFFEYYDFAERFALDFKKFPLEQRLIAREIEHGLFNLKEHDDYYKNWRHDQIPRKEVFEFVRTNKKLLYHLKSVLISSKVQMEIGEEVLGLAEEILDSIKIKK